MYKKSIKKAGISKYVLRFLLFRMKKTAVF